MEKPWGGIMQSKGKGNLGYLIGKIWPDPPLPPSAIPHPSDPTGIQGGREGNDFSVSTAGGLEPPSYAAIPGASEIPPIHPY